MATYKKPSNMGVLQFIDQPGWYHLLVNNINEEPQKNNGEVMDAIRVETVCQAGTNPEQAKKSFSPLLFNPSEGDSDGGEFKSKIHLRLADALCLLPPASAGEEVEIDWQKAKGRQFIALAKWGKERNGEKFMEIDGAHIYHVDDPDVAKVPKNMQAVNLMPASMRRISTDPNNARNHAPAANGNGKSATAANKPAGGAAKAAAKTPSVSNDAAPSDVGGTVDLDNI